MLIGPLLDKMHSIAALSEDDVACIRRLRIEERQFKAGQDIVLVGDHPTKSFLLSEGFVCMYKIAGSGGRQIVSLHVTGDMPDLQSLYLHTMDVSVAALTNARLSFIAHDDIRAACLSNPGLTKAFWRMSLIDAGTARAWIVNVGQREGMSRLANLLCELYTRLGAVGLVRDKACFLPVTQTDLADATGMTPVHVNRMLKDLRAKGLIQLSRRTLTIPDWDRLATMADFDPTYLQLVAPPSSKSGV